MATENQLTPDALYRIKELVDNALYASAKPQAIAYIAELEHLRNSSNLAPYCKQVFTELVNAVKNASGRVSNKVIKVKNAHDSYYKFELFSIHHE